VIRVLCKRGHIIDKLMEIVVNDGYGHCPECGTMLFCIKIVLEDSFEINNNNPNYSETERCFY